ncbi:TlpA family protein disulfide reductase [Deinococcus peraridilitoris]|nr:hypothetical protein [Deinococcus peraridilitoris]
MIAVVSNMLFPKRGVGKSPPASFLYPSSGRRLFYFRNKGCIICGLIDMKVASAAHQSGVTLIIIDRWPHEGRPKQSTPYLDDVGNIVDSDGTLNKAFDVAIYPTFVFVDDSNKIVVREVGAEAKPEVFDEHLLKHFNAHLDIPI